MEDKTRLTEEPLNEVEVKYNNLEEQFKNPIIKVSIEHGVIINRHKELWDTEGVVTVRHEEGHKGAPNI